MSDYLKKPLSRRELFATVEQQLIQAAHHALIDARANANPAAATAPNVVENQINTRAATEARDATLRPGHTVPPDGAAAEAAPPLDCESLSERFMGDWDFVQVILAKFQQQLDVDLGQLEKSVLERNAKQTAALAHRIKGAAANVSAVEVSRLASELEVMGREDYLDEAGGRLTQIKNECRRVNDFVEADLPGLVAGFAQ